MKTIEPAFSGKVEFKRIDVDKEHGVAFKYVVFTTPTLVLEKDGIEINRWVGEPIEVKDVFIAALNAALNAAITGKPQVYTTKGGMGCYTSASNYPPYMHMQEESTLTKESAEPPSVTQVAIDKSPLSQDEVEDEHVKGVTLNRGLWEVRAKVDGKRTYIGSFAAKEDAIKAKAEAEGART